MPSGKPTAEGAGNGTSRQLERAALALLKKNGVLAGLNLREVADLAKVNRGLVYHYFGSRAELLRAALRRNSARRFDDYVPGDRVATLADWMTQWMRSSLKFREQVQLAALLTIDGDTRLRIMPRRERTQAIFRRMRESGHTDSQLDSVALHSLLHSAGMGYVILRRELAAEFGIGVRELDRRVVELVGQIGERFQVGPAGDWRGPADS